MLICLVELIFRAYCFLFGLQKNKIQLTRDVGPKNEVSLLPNDGTGSQKPKNSELNEDFRH